MILKGPEAQISVKILHFLENQEFPIFPETSRVSLKFLEVAEIPRRGHWPRPSCPGLTKQSKLHRFRRGKASKGPPRPPETTKIHDLNRIHGIHQNLA